MGYLTYGIFALVLFMSAAENSTDVNFAHVESPCPTIFRYSFRTPPLGIFRLAIDEPFDEVDIKAIFSIPGQGENIGRFQLLGANDVEQEDGGMERRLKYKIQFPNVSYLPRLTLLTINDEEICSGPKYTEPEYNGIQSISRDELYVHFDGDAEDKSLL